MPKRSLHQKDLPLGDTPSLMSSRQPQRDARSAHAQLWLPPFCAGEGPGCCHRLSLVIAAPKKGLPATFAPLLQTQPPPPRSPRTPIRHTLPPHTPAPTQFPIAAPLPRAPTPLPHSSCPCPHPPTTTMAQAGRRLSFVGHRALRTVTVLWE